MHVNCNNVTECKLCFLFIVTMIGIEIVQYINDMISMITGLPLLQCLNIEEMSIHQLI